MHIDPSSLKIPNSIIILIFTYVVEQLDKISYSYTENFIYLTTWNKFVSPISVGSDISIFPKGPRGVPWTK